MKDRLLIRRHPPKPWRAEPKPQRPEQARLFLPQVTPSAVSTPKWDGCTEANGCPEEGPSKKEHATVRERG